MCAKCGVVPMLIKIFFDPCHRVIALTDSYTHIENCRVPCGVVVSMLGYHAGDPSSIPRFSDDGSTGVIVIR